MASTTKLTKECPICCEYFTSYKRIPIECIKCSFTACRTCIEKYVLSKEVLEVTCMNRDCDSVWTRAFLTEHFTKAFINKTYRAHHGNILFHGELSRMPETIPYVERRKKRDKIDEELKVICKERDRIRYLYNTIKSQENKLRHAKWRLDRNEPEIKEKKEFIRKCPAEDCRGFLSSGWKCKICSIRVCAKCHEIKALQKKGGGGGGDGNTDHTCKEENIKSVELMKKDTKNCPSCACMIHKISGCDQMWCTQCQVAFSWRTGCKVKGVVHNPHFYQWQRENGSVERTVGDIPCGGFPAVQSFWSKIRAQRQLQLGHARKSYDQLRQLRHFQRVEMYNYRIIENQEEDKKLDYRIHYLLNEITEKNMKSRLASLDMRNNKRRDIYHIMELMQTVGMERMIALYNNPSTDEYENMQKTLNAVRDYCNDELRKISKIYNNQCVPLIDENFRCGRQKNH